MVSLQSVRPFVYAAFFASVISGCTTDSGSVAAPTPAVTTTTTVPPTSVPQIAHLAANFSTNSCVRPADGLTALALVVTFDYVDMSGDLAGGHVTVNRVYNTGRSESHSSLIPSEVTLSGTPSAGQLTISNACPLYDNATSSTETFTLFDANGLASNILSIVVNRPPGDR
jgi:hypothetical protein